jgi:hypothetical protein
MSVSNFHTDLNAFSASITVLVHIFLQLVHSYFRYFGLCGCLYYFYGNRKNIISL